MMSKKGLSDIVTNVLIILLVLVAVGILWFFIQPFIFGSVSDINTAQYTMNLDIVSGSALVDAGNQRAQVQVRRGSGGGELVALKVVLEGANEVRAVRYNVSIGELETKTIAVDYVAAQTGVIQAISIAPILRLPSGKEFEGQPTDREAVIAGSVAPSPPSNSLSLTLHSPQSIPYSFSYEPHVLDLEYTVTSGSTCSYRIDSGSNVAIPGCQSPYQILVNSGASTITITATKDASTLSRSASINVNICTGDIDGSGNVQREEDLNVLISAINSGSFCTSLDCQADVDGDNQIDKQDLITLYQSMRGENQQPGGGCSKVCFLDCNADGLLNNADVTCFAAHNTLTNPLEYYDIDNGSETGTLDGLANKEDDDYYNILYTRATTQGLWPGCE